MRAERTRLILLTAAIALVAACSSSGNAVTAPCGLGFPCTGRRSVAQVALAPFPATLSVGDTATIIAAAFDSTGAQITGVSFQFASSAADVASVDGTGLVTALAAGSTTISAATGGQKATVVLFVR
ncbi:MAG TPA: Ig-like domain-containing protein [Gemmatimonadaceae bacterium]